MKLVYLMLATATLLPAASQAKWKPQYASNSLEIRDWYKSRKLTDAAAKRFTFKSCGDGSDRAAHRYRCNHFTLTRHRSVARAAQFLAWPARTHARPRIRREACIGRRRDRVSEFATVTKGFYDVLLFSAGVVGHVGKSEPVADWGAKVAPEWAPYPGDGGSGDAR